MSDYLVRVMSKTGNVRGLACVTTDLAREAAQRQDALPTAATALARALTGGALLGALLKTRQRLALKFEGNGPLRKIIVEADSNGAVRGMVGDPKVLVTDAEGRLDVAAAIGKAGLLTVTKDLGVKDLYQSVIPLYTSEIGEDIAWYLTDSEQVPSAVGLGVAHDPTGMIAAAGGFLLQSLPPRDEAVVDRLMGRITELPSLSEMLRDGKTPEELLELLFADIPYTILEKRAVAFVCSCNRERIERMLKVMGQEELQEMIADPGEAEVTCEFCRQKYHFSRNDLERLVAETAASPEGPA